MKKFFLFLLPAWVVTYIVFNVTQKIGLEATQLPLYQSGVWLEERQILDTYGLGAWFVIIPLLFGAFLGAAF